MIKYRFTIESPYIGSDYEDIIEFDVEPSEQDLIDCLEVMYSNHFPGGWERIKDDEV